MVCRLAVCALLLVAGTVRAEEAKQGAGAAEKSPCGGGACSKSKADGQAAHTGCTKSLTALAKAEKCCADDAECAGCEKSGGKCNRCCATGEKAMTLDEALVQAAAITFNVTSAAQAPCAPRPLSGAAFSPAQELLQQKLAQRDELQHEIDELCESTKTYQQVLVRVKVMEVSLTKMRKLGIDFAPGYHVFNSDEFATSATESCASECNVGECCTEECGAVECGTEECSAEKCCSEKCDTEKCSTKLCGTEKCSAATCSEETCGDGECCAEKSSCQACSHCTDDNGLASFLDALEENNIAKVLAQPTVVTVSGRPASFQVGGEVPIPVPGSSAYTFKDFGTKLHVLAVAQGGNRVRLEIRSRTSEICDDRSLVVDGNTIPSLLTNECDTACDLEFGQTVALTGLTSRRTEAFQTEDGVRERTNEVMQVLVVTPEVVTSTARLSTVTK